MKMRVDALDLGGCPGLQDGTRSSDTEVVTWNRRVREVPSCIGRNGIGNQKLGDRADIAEGHVHIGYAVARPDNRIGAERKLVGKTDPGSKVIVVAEEKFIPAYLRERKLEIRFRYSRARNGIIERCVFLISHHTIRRVHEPQPVKLVLGRSIKFVTQPEVDSQIACDPPVVLNEGIPVGGSGSSNVPDIVDFRVVGNPQQEVGKASLGVVSWLIGSVRPGKVIVAIGTSERSSNRSGRAGR